MGLFVPVIRFVDMDSVMVALVMVLVGKMVVFVGRQADADLDCRQRDQQACRNQ
ncbi:MAG: hypothetical protein HQM03_18935 [Magnetococcales bacterium]|nr:hypothetical protein [Magnetococcales bacterium]